MFRFAQTDARFPQTQSLREEGQISRRRLTRDVSLSRLAVDWLAELPPNVRPNELMVRFPHVANNLAKVWHERKESCEYFDSLFHDRRGGRRGFPPRIALELTVLKQHHDVLLRRPQRYNWNDAVVR